MPPHVRAGIAPREQLRHIPDPWSSPLFPPECKIATLTPTQRLGEYLCRSLAVAGDTHHTTKGVPAPDRRSSTGRPLADPFREQSTARSLS